MGKSNTIFNPMSGRETELTLILDLHQNSIFQRRSYTPFWATLPGHIPYLWKTQHGAYCQQSLRNRPGTTKRHFSKKTEAGSGEEETSGAVGGQRAKGGGGTARGRIRRTGLIPDWLGWFRRKSQLQRSSQELSNFSAAAGSGFRRLGLRGGYPCHCSYCSARAANNSCPRRRHPKEGREEEREGGGTDRCRSRVLHALVLATWGDQERVSTTTTVKGALSWSVIPPASRAPSRSPRASEPLVASSGKLSPASVRRQKRQQQRQQQRGSARASAVNRLGSRAQSRQPGWRRRAAACRLRQAVERAATVLAGPHSKHPSTSGGTSSTTSTHSGSPSSASCTPITTCLHRRRRPRPSPSPSARCSHHRRPPCHHPRRRPGQLVAAMHRAGPLAVSGIAATPTQSATCIVAPWTEPPTRWRPATGPA